jgi:hypothetical protein
MPRSALAYAALQRSLLCSLLLPESAQQPFESPRINQEEGTQEESDQRLIDISDCKEAVLSQREWRATADYALFHFTQSRTLGNPELFSDCTFADLFIDHKTHWGAPIPATFQVFFEDIVRALLPPGHKLVLNVSDFYEGCDAKLKWGALMLCLRALVRAVHLAFAVLSNHNGLFLVTDKLDNSELRSLIDSSGIEKQIREYLTSEKQ